MQVSGAENVILIYRSAVRRTQHLVGALKAQSGTRGYRGECMHMHMCMHMGMHMCVMLSHISHIMNIYTSLTLFLPRSHTWD